MGFVYDINSTKKDSKSKNCLFACHMLSGIINLFVSTFLIAYIYTLNNNVYDYIFNVGIYNMSLYATFAVFYIAISYLVDKSNRICLYRVGLFLRACLVVVLIFFGEKLANLLVVAGIVVGISESFYYSSYNVLRQEMVSRQNTSSYSVAIYTLSKVVEVVCPVLLGALIDVTTYSQVAIIVLAICVLQIGISFGVKSKRPENSGFNLKKYFDTLKEKPESKKKLSLIYIICSIYGSSILINMILNICIMLQFGSSLSLGIITSIFALVSVVVILLVNKFTKAGKRSWLFWCLSIAMLASGIMMIFQIDKITVIIFNAIFAIVSIIYKCIFDIHRNSILKEDGLYNEISEHHAVVEVIVDISRALCFLLLMLVSLFKSLLAFKIFLLLNCLVLAIVLFLLMVYEKKYIKPQ